MAKQSNLRIRMTVLFLLAWGIRLYAAPKDVVTQFGQYLSNWCITDDVTYRDRIERICSGVKSCRVEDDIHAAYQRKRGYMDYETYVLDSYLNMFQTIIPGGVKYHMSNIIEATSDQYPDGQTLTFVLADVTVNGKINQTVKELFLVRDDKISGIYTYNSKYGFQHLNGSLISELKRGQYVGCYPAGDDGFFVLTTKDSRNCLIDTKGNILFPPIGGNDWIMVRNYDNRLFAQGGWGVSAFAFQDVIYEIRNGNSIKVPFEFFSNSYDNSICEEEFKLGCRDLDLVGISGFSNGYAVVKKYFSDIPKYGYLKKDDYQYNIDFKFDKATHFYKGLACVVNNGTSMIIDDNFNIIVCAPSGYEIPERFYFDSKKIIIKRKSSGLEGVMDFNGQIIIPCKYQALESVHEGLAAAELNGKIGFINTKGNMVVPFVYESVYYYQDGVCWVSRSRDSDYDDFRYVNSHKSWELIDNFGNVLIDNVFFYSSDDINFKRGFTRVFRRIEGEKRCTLIDNRGKVLPGFSWSYSYIDFPQDNSLIHFEKNGKHGFVDLRGQLIIDAVYDDASNFLNHSAVVGKRINGEMKYGLINEYGTYLFVPIYDGIRRDNKGRFCSVKKKNNGTFKYGAVDNNGNIVIPFNYDDYPEYYDLNIPFDFNGYARVCKKVGGWEKYGYVDKNGVLIIPCIYENDNTYPLVFYQGIAFAIKNGRVGLIDLYGNSVFI